MKSFFKKLEKFFNRHLDKLAVLSTITLGGKNVILIALMLLVLYLLTNSDKSEKKHSEKNTSETKEKKEDASSVSSVDDDSSIETASNYEIKVEFDRVHENKEEEKPVSEDKSEKPDVPKEEEKSQENVSAPRLIKKNVQVFKNRKVSHIEDRNTDFENKNPYKNNMNYLEECYKNSPGDYTIPVKIQQSSCSIPLFNLRHIPGLDFNFNFIIHNFDQQQINNLIMCKDIHKWMNTSTISSSDIQDEYYPVYFVKKQNGVIGIFEIYKLFIHTNEQGLKVGFVQMGNDLFDIKEYIDTLIEKKYIQDLLHGQKFFNYNLSEHDDAIDFLEKFLSLVLPPENLIGETIELDLEIHSENKKTVSYLYDTLNSDTVNFNTTL